MIELIFQQSIRWFKSLFYSKELIAKPLTHAHIEFLKDKVSFYVRLSDHDKKRFEQRCSAFIQDTEIIGHDVDVTDEDKLLIASSSVILAWGFSEWHYVKVDRVSLVSGSFNDNAQIGRKDSNIGGLVGTRGYLKGKMILSKPALHYGFSNDRDKRNVAIHEFAHLIDLADGECDGLPQQIVDKAYCLPWLDLVKKGIEDIQKKRSSVRPYGGTNNAEFFAVVSEYFFERPKLLKAKSPMIYTSLESFYQQNLADLQTAIKIRKKAPCPCGSGKRYKRCCLVKILRSE